MSLATIDDGDDALFCQLYLAAYPVDNLQIAAFIENRFDNTYFSIEVEYQLPVRGLSFFANAMQGDHGYDHAFVGMRYYFGEDKPLKSRHRQDDPRNTLTGIRHGIGNWQAEIGEKISKSSNMAAYGGGGSIGGSGTIGGQPGGGTLTVIGPGYGGSHGGSLTIGGQPGGGTVTLAPGTITLGGGSTPGGTLINQYPTGSTLTLSSFNHSGPAPWLLSPLVLGSGATIHGPVP